MRLILAVSCILIAVLIGASCLGLSGLTGTSPPVPTSEPTPGPTLVPVSFPPSPVVTALPYEAVRPSYRTPVYTPPATTYPPLVYQTSASPIPTQAGPEPSDPAAITFLHYSDPNFAVDYPSTWKLTRPGYVRFTSGSGRVWFTAEVDDFLPAYQGQVRLNPDISAVQDMVSREFPGYDARYIMYDYRNTMMGAFPVTMYSVRLPGQIAYRRYLFVTSRHGYRFTFTSDSVLSDELAPLREFMFGSLVIHDQP